MLEPQHAEAMYDAVNRNREHLSKWFPWVEDTVDAGQMRSFILVEAERYLNNDGFSLGIFHNGDYIGNISFHEIDWSARLTSIGYWISLEYQGRGIITSCCRTLLRYGFQSLELNKIEIRARTDNVRSRAIPLKLGFKEEGTLRHVSYHNGRYYDHVVYGLLKDEWDNECTE